MYTFTLPFEVPAGSPIREPFRHAGELEERRIVTPRALQLVEACEDDGAAPRGRRCRDATSAGRADAGSDSDSAARLERLYEQERAE